MTTKLTAVNGASVTSASKVIRPPKVCSPRFSAALLIPSSETPSLPKAQSDLICSMSGSRPACLMTIAKHDGPQSIASCCLW